MGKRRRAKESEDYIKKKIRKLEKKLQKRKESETREDSRESQEQELPEGAENNIGVEAEIPPELLAALGPEGGESSTVGDPINKELAQRWTKIMLQGLTKEAREEIVNKYSTPQNFPDAAPILNEEIKAILSEASLKRDRRIVVRQNLTAKLMTCLGRSLTNILKGNLNSKSLVEEINDAAKIAADVFHVDTISRRYFALSGTNTSMKEAMKKAKTDELLFGKDCADNIKSAQSIQRASQALKNTGSKNAKGLLQQQYARSRPIQQQKLPIKYYSSSEPVYQQKALTQYRHNQYSSQTRTRKNGPRNNKPAQSQPRRIMSNR